jgi:hypothetical protein
LLIRPILLSDGLSIRSDIRTSKPVETIEPKSQNKVTVLMEDFDTGIYSKKLFDYCLMDFRGPISLEIEEGKELSITDGMTQEEINNVKKEMKVALFDDKDVREFVSEISEKMQSTDIDKLREELKNWKVSQSGL